MLRYAARHASVRVSSVARYRGAFSPRDFHGPDAHTALLLHFDRVCGPFFIDHAPPARPPIGAYARGMARLQDASRKARQY